MKGMGPVRKVWESGTSFLLFPANPIPLLLCAFLIGCSERPESISVNNLLSRFDDGWISHTNYGGDSSEGNFPIDTKDLGFTATESAYKKDTLEFCHPKYDISFENGDSLKIDIEVCWNGQARYKLIEANRIKRFEDGSGNRVSAIFDSAFHKAQLKWGTDAIDVAVPQISAVLSECNKLGFVCWYPKLPCDSQSGIIPVWYIRNGTNTDLVQSLKSRYGKGKKQGKDCAG